MNNKSTLIALMMLMISSGCTSSDKAADYKVGSAMGDNLTKTDNTTSTRGSSFGFWPLFFGRSAVSPVAGAAATQGTIRDQQNNMQNNNQQNQGRQSDLKARGSRSFSGSFGS